MIKVIDYGIGNVGSVINMLNHLGYAARAANNIEDLEDAKSLILPGVGHFDVCMSMLQDSGLIPGLENSVLKNKTPILGICAGAQILGESSDEGKSAGLGWIKMKSKKFDSRTSLKIPHMGWNYVAKTEIKNPLTDNMKGEQRFYFVHSYRMDLKEENNVILTCDYGGQFPAAICSNNIYGVQFHPEKSHKFGKDLLESFLKIR